MPLDHLLPAMPFQLTGSQFDGLAEDRLLNKLREILQAGADDPAAVRAELDSPSGQAVLRQQVARARHYGLSAELDLARYVITAWLLGVDFDTRFAAMAEVLNSPRLSPSQKADALERITTTLLGTLHGTVPP